VSVDPVAAAGFGSVADVYERARPSYPEAAVQWIADLTGLGPGRVVADVGAGTGKLTRLLLSTGARVIAVEPIQAMREVLRESVAGVEVMDGVAESLPLADASVDVVTVAQAFHWFDHAKAIPELHRVLRPGGALVLIWNSRDMSDPLQRALEELLAPLRQDAPYQLGGAWRKPLDASELFAAPDEARFAIEQQMTRQGVRDRITSTSFVAAMPTEERAALLQRVDGLTEGRDEPFAFPYVTEVYVAERSNAST